MYKNIVFDFGNVLVQWDPSFIYQNHFKCADKAALFFQETQLYEINKKLDRGASFDSELETLAQRFPHYRKAIFLWRDSWSDMLRGEMSDTVKILERLQGKNYPLYAITNWSAEKFPYARANFPFIKYFKDIVVSGEVKAIKPEPEIFQLLLQRNQLIAEECIFIDDMLENVMAANELGFVGVHFKSAELLEERLKELGIL